MTNTDNLTPDYRGPAATSLPARNWGWFALRGVLLLVLGALALAFPGPALFSFALVFAAFCLVDGIFAVVSGVSGAKRKEDHWLSLILTGILGIAVGVAFLAFPALGTVAYAVAALLLIAGWAIVSGFLQIAAAWRIRREISGEWLLMLLGGLSVLLGLALVALLWLAPIPALASVAWIIGIWALMAGIASLFLAYRLRRANHEPEPRQASVTG